MPTAIIILAIGIIIGFGIAWAIKKPKSEVSEKEAGKQNIIQHIRERGSITNDGVERFVCLLFLFFCIILLPYESAAD